MNFIQNIFQNNRNRQSRPRPSDPSSSSNSQGGPMGPSTTGAASSARNNGNGGHSTAASPRNHASNAFGARPPSQPRREQPHPMNPLDFLTQQLHAAAQSAFSAQQQHQHQQQQQQSQTERPMSPTRAAPPASTKAIRQLPTVSVTPEDLVDENNRECCICFEENQLHDKVMRLPCAHIYHPKCIIEWLNRHCTCPVCRYELPTDNVVYERERKQRMKFRKPRYARYELERMQMKELKSLCIKLNVFTLGMMEKKEFVDALIASEKIIVISAPEPIEYQSVKVLRSMGVGQLKKAMKEAGVFFDSKDVVEKEDMVQIFVNSGRIVLTEKADESLNNTNATTSNSSGNQCVDPYGNFCPDYDERYGEEAKRARLDDDDGVTYTASSHTCSVSSAPVACGDMDVVSEDGHTLSQHGTDHVSNLEQKGEETFTEDQSIPVEEENQETTVMSHSSHDEMSDGHVVRSEMNTEHVSETTTATATATTTTTTTINNQNPNQDDMTDTHDSQIGMNTEDIAETTAGNQSPPLVDIFSSEQPSFATRSIGEIRQLASSLNVDVSSCIEKAEMVQLIMEAIVSDARRRHSA